MRRMVVKRVGRTDGGGLFLGALVLRLRLPTVTQRHAKGRGEVNGEALGEARGEAKRRRACDGHPRRGDEKDEHPRHARLAKRGGGSFIHLFIFVTSALIFVIFYFWKFGEMSQNILMSF